MRDPSVPVTQARTENIFNTVSSRPARRLVGYAAAGGGADGPSNETDHRSFPTGPSASSHQMEQWNPEGLAVHSGAAEFSRDVPMAILIHGIRIYGFRSLRRVSIDAIDEYAPLIGLNGSGKSNVLRCLSLFFRVL